MTDNGSIFFVSFSLSFLNSVTRHCIIVFFFFSALHGVNDRREVILQGAFIYTQHVRSAARLHSFFFLLRFFFSGAAAAASVTTEDTTRVRQSEMTRRVFCLGRRLCHPRDVIRTGPATKVSPPALQHCCSTYW